MPTTRARAAVAGLRHANLRQVGREDHTTLLRLLADRHHDLASLRTQAACRLHALLCALAPGGLSRELSAAKAATVLRTVRPTGQVEIERKRLAHELLADIRRLDTKLRLANSGSRLRWLPAAPP
jgi:transposase